MRCWYSLLTKQKNTKVEEIEQTIYSIKSANRKLETEKEVVLDDAERSKNIALGEIKTKINHFGEKIISYLKMKIKALNREGCQRAKGFRSAC